MFAAVLVAVLGTGALGLPPARARQIYLRDGMRVHPAPPLVPMAREAPKISVGWYSSPHFSLHLSPYTSLPQWALRSS